MNQNKWSKILTIALAIGIPGAIFLGELEAFHRMGNKAQQIFVLYQQLGWVFSFAVFFYLIFPSWNLYKNTGQKSFKYLALIFGLKTFVNLFQRLLSYTLYSQALLLDADNIFLIILRYLSQMLNSTITYIIIPFLFIIAIKNFIGAED